MLIEGDSIQMNGKAKETTQSEVGLTLVEVLASIVILSIIITTFLLVFNQSAKTTYQSEETIDATYIAQTEMEWLYELSQISTVKERESTLLDEGYGTPHTEDKWTVYQKSVQEDQYQVVAKLNDEDDNALGMTRVLIQVFEQQNDAQLKAQMENVLQWGQSES